MKNKIILLAITFILTYNLYAQYTDTIQVYYDNGNLKSTYYNSSTFFENGNSIFYIAKGIEYYENGNIKRLFYKKDGELDSLEQHWYENGQKSLQLSYEMGKKEGVSLEWYKTGELLSVSYYKDNKEEGTWYDFFKNGEIRTITNYRNGKANGITIFYNEKGNVINKGYFKDGKGVLKVYDETGKLTTEHYYNNFPLFSTHTKTYRDGGYALSFDCEYGTERVEYYDKTGVKYKIVKYDAEGNKEVNDLKEKE